MKKVLTFFLILSSVNLFSQEWQIIESGDMLFQFDQIRVRVNSENFHNSGLSLRTTLKFNDETFEVSEGLVIPLGEYVEFTPSVGFEYIHDQKEINPILHGTLRGNFDWGKVRINYGSNWLSHGVSSSVVYNIGNNFRIGIATSDEYIGPRAEFRSFSGKDKYELRIHVSYTEELNYGIRIKYN